MHIPIITNKKLFEKNLQKISGFEKATKSQGIDGRSMLFIPDHQILAVAGLHEQGERTQYLSLYKIDASVDQSSSLPKKFGQYESGKKRKKNNAMQKRNSALCTLSKTSLLENMISAKLNKSKTNVYKSNSGQSMNVGKEKHTEFIIQEQQEEEPPSKFWFYFFNVLLF